MAREISGAGHMPSSKSFLKRDAMSASFATKRFLTATSHARDN
jgi:hypothetical protein